jgi:ribosomal protein L3 glutamine methyltransferase
MPSVKSRDTRQRRASPPRPGTSRLRDLLLETERRLKAARVSYGHGTTNARDEAAWLVLHALKLPLDVLDPHLERMLTAAEAKRVRALVDERIRTRKPAAYLTHEAWLGEYSFYVDERVIVPRSYIAELLRENLSPWIAAPARLRSALDLCTGSGCLAILAALTFPRAHVDASDVSADALKVARRNVTRYAMRERLDLLKSDLYGALAGRTYDLILSNPPYVSAAVMRSLPLEYRREPALALAGGRDGLDLVRRILAHATDHLNPGGVLVVEVGHNRARVEKAVPHLPLVWAETSGGDDCVFVITREALEAQAPPRPPAPPRVRSPRATREAASPHPPAARSPARASGAAAKRRRRSARASGG